MAGVEQREPPVYRSGGSLRSTPATPSFEADKAVACVAKLPEAIQLKKELEQEVGRPVVNSAFCVAGRGIIIRSIAAPLTATGTIPPIATTACFVFCEAGQNKTDARRVWWATRFERPAGRLFRRKRDHYIAR